LRFVKEEQQTRHTKGARATLKAQALVDDPDAFMLEITKIIQNKHAHPVIAQISTLMCVMTCLLQNVSLSDQKAKQSYRNDESSAVLSSLPVNSCYVL